MRNQKLAGININAGCDAGCDDWTFPQAEHIQARSAQTLVEAFDQQQDLLEQIVEINILPRLLLAHSQALVTAPAVSGMTAAKIAEQVGDFSDLVIKRDATASTAYFEAMRAEGASIEALFQDLLAPTARRLGVLWEQDINDFTDVTRGLMHLHQIVLDFSSEFRSEGRNPISNRRALLMPLPGENHTFGISLISEYFRREGWRVWDGPPQSVDDIIELVDGQWFDIIGLSVSKLPNPEKVGADIRAIRRASHNKNVTVLVGGRIFVEQPDMVAAVGADATAVDGNQAVLQVTELIGPGPKNI